MVETGNAVVGEQLGRPALVGLRSDGGGGHPSNHGAHEQRERRRCRVTDAKRVGARGTQRAELRLQHTRRSFPEDGTPELTSGDGLGASQVKWCHTAELYLSGSARVHVTGNV